MTTDMKMANETPEQERRRLRRVLTATLVGTTVEWYDFYLYATMASIVFGTLFFDPESGESATLKAIATFAVGFVARPIGGIIFGRLGDRIGRKQTLVITFALMGTSTFLVGVLPTYERIGIAAPIALVVLRIFQGMGAGAEYAGAAVNSYEHAKANRRGRQGAWPALGLNLGLVLSSATIYLLTLNGDEFLLNGGWRIPFILSIGLVGIGLWVRRALPESPAYEGEKAKFSDVFRLHWRGLAVVLIVAIGYNALSYIFKTFSIAYLKGFQDISANVASGTITVAGLVAIVAVPLFGEACDRFGAKKVIAVGGLVSAAYAFIFLHLLSQGAVWSSYLAVAVGTGVLAPMMFSAQGAFLSRQFPTEVRSTGVGVAREVGTAIAGGLAPLGALSLVVSSPTNSTFGVGIVMAVAGLLVVVGAVFDQGRRYTSEKN